MPEYRTASLTLPANLSEDAFKRTVIETAHWYGWRVMHTRPAKNRRGQWSTPLEGDPGFPDLALARSGQVILAELKTNRGQTSNDQDLWLAELGVFGRVWRPRDWPTILPELQHGVQQ